MMLGTPGSMTLGPKIQYLRTLLYIEALREFENKCDQTVNITTTRLNQILLVLSA